ncbi:MAG: DUF1559 domain-containing protein [Pirellulales bacterium]|nr:DUF1559 domain-containing protein [Pirellulales bacterium]
MACAATSKKTRLRVGFTLVELLVVIAIIGVLVALLLPAVQAAREAARRTQCLNHLKQIGLGSMSHHDVHSHFPSGGWGFLWVGDPDRGFGEAQPGGWAYNILPFIEQQTLHDLGAGTTGDAREQANSIRIGTPLETLNCPSRRPATTYPAGTIYKHLREPNHTASTADVARSDYAANGGENIFPYGTGPNSYAVEARFSWPDQSTATGIMYGRSNVGMRQITDGTSNTYMVAEKYLNPDKYSTGTDSGDNENMYMGFNEDIVRWTGDGVELLLPPLPDTPGVWGRNGFGSAHAGLMNAAFCDGSVRSISYSIDEEIHRRLGNRKDGLPVDAG